MEVSLYSRGNCSLEQMTRKRYIEPINYRVKTDAFTRSTKAFPSFPRRSKTRVYTVYRNKNIPKKKKEKSFDKGKYYHSFIFSSSVKNDPTTKPTQRTAVVREKKKKKSRAKQSPLTY